MKILGINGPLKDGEEITAKAFATMNNLDRNDPERATVEFLLKQGFNMERVPTPPPPVGRPYTVWMEATRKGGLFRKALSVMIAFEMPEIRFDTAPQQF